MLVSGCGGMRPPARAIPAPDSAPVSNGNIDGAVARLDRLVADINRRFGRTPVIQRLNRSPAPEQARARAHDPAILRRIEALTEGDARVYEHAVRIVGAG